MNKAIKDTLIYLGSWTFLLSQTQGRDLASNYSSEIKIGSKIVKIQIESKPYFAKEHVINPEKHNIDGKGSVGIGHNSDDPEIGIKFITVDWDGKNIELPSNLFDDVYSPALTNVAYETTGLTEGILLIPDSKNESLMIRMLSFRCASSTYCIYWIIQKNGFSTRFVQLMGT